MRKAPVKSSPQTNTNAQFLQDRCPPSHSTNIVKALKYIRFFHMTISTSPGMDRTWIRKDWMHFTVWIQ